MSLHTRERNPVAAAVEPAVRFMLIACGWWLMVIVLLTCIEILGRKFFGFSLQGVDEIGGYTLGVTASISFAYALLKRGHTRVDFFLTRFSPTVQAVCNLLAMLSLAALVFYAFWRGITVLSESLEFQSRSTTPLQVPLWIPQSGWLFGWAMFAATSVVFAVHALILFLRDRDRLNAYYGPLTVDEEIQAEVGENTAGESARAGTASAPDGSGAGRA